MDWRLTSLDLFTLNMTIKGAWIYRDAPDFIRMKAALEELAEMYPHLGGRYCEQTKSVRWEDGKAADLPFTSCDLRSHTVDELIGNSSIWSLVRPYDTNAFKKGSVSPFSAVLGYLKDGAVLFMQCAHATMDGATFYAFAGQWAALYKGEPVSAMTVDQALVPAPDSLSKEETVRQVLEKGWLRIKAGQLIRMLWNLGRNNRIKTTHIIEISQEQIADLKKASGAGTNAALTALAMKAFSEHAVREKSYRLLFVADLRSRFTGIDDTFFGNLSQPVVADGMFSPNEDLPSLAAGIDSSLKEALVSGRAEENVRLSQCSSHYGLPYFYFDASDMNCPDPGTIYINNQLKFRACELDWGTGLPAYAFPNELIDMVKFWQPVSAGPVQLIFGGLASKIMERPVRVAGK